MTKPLLHLEDLYVEIEGKEILKGVTLTVNPGEIHALMGRNGAGKSTLTHTLMGHPQYKVTRGKIHFRGEEITTLPVEERARKGIFLAFQYPTAIPGVSVGNFLRSSLKVIRGAEVPIREFRTKLLEQFAVLKIPKEFAARYVNDGFSGGEKKRLEILQLALLNPSLCLLDETDSGLDIDALKVVSDGINQYMGPKHAVLLITHYQRILDYVHPQFVHVMIDGRIVQSGGPELARELEAKGYDWLDGKAA